MRAFCYLTALLAVSLSCAADRLVPNGRPLTVSSVNPTSGPTTGGTVVTVTGTGFPSNIETVTFGGTAGSNISVIGDSIASVTTPAHAAGVVDVKATLTTGLSATATAAFTYVNPNPTLTQISPTNGPTAGGTNFTLTGTGFLTGATVAFGGAAATNVVVANGISITGTTPAHAAGAVNVVVTNTDQTTATLTAGFTYNAPPGIGPTIVDISRTAGSAAGGATVVITGTNFLAGTAVAFGGTASPSVTVNSATQLTVVVPAHAVGVVNVAVTSEAVTATLTNAFEYLPAPTTTYFSNTFESNALAPLVGDPAPGGTVSVSTDFAFAGTRSAKSSQNTTVGGGAGVTFQFGGSTPPNPAASEPNGLYMRWYLYVPTSTVDRLQDQSPSTAQMKLHLYRLTTGSGQPGWVMCGVGRDFPPGRVLTCFIDNGIFFISGGTTSFQLGDGVWLELQLWYKRVGSQGRSRMWVNGKQIFDVTSNFMGNDDLVNFYKAYFGGVYVESPNGAVVAYIDNVAGANGFIDP